MSVVVVLNVKCERRFLSSILSWLVVVDNTRSKSGGGEGVQVNVGGVVMQEVVVVEDRKSWLSSLTRGPAESCLGSVSLSAPQHEQHCRLTWRSS